MEARLTDAQRSSIRLLTLGVVVLSACLPLVTLGGAALDSTSGGPIDPRLTAYAAIATACYLPLQVWLVWAAAHDTRPRAQAWALAAVAVVILGMVPVIGVRWIGALASLAGLVLIVVRPPWSLLLFAGLAAAPAPLAVAFGYPERALISTLSPLVVAVSLAAPVWLIRTARQLQAARLALAEDAVVRERLRIDGEVRRTVGTALEAIAAAGERAEKLAVHEPAAAGSELDVLVGRSRRALTEARRMLTRYQEVSLRAELETATTLLAAAGIQAGLEPPPGELNRVPGEAERTALRRDLTRLLRTADPDPTPTGAGTTGAGAT